MRNKSPISVACLGGALFLATLLGGTAMAQAPAPATPGGWERDDWNPAPDSEDLILPLPCKGSMALRRVLTGPSRDAGKSNQHEDRPVTLGSTDDPQNYVGYVRGEYIAGGFFTNTGQRYYLIGKYEVTVQQYEAVMGDGSCKPTPSEKAALPMSNVSWFDAVEFTRRWNKYIYAERLDAMPRSADRAGFVRLPSEIEWEYAARGGMSVSDAERANPTFVPQNAKLSEYAWYAGPESSGGQLKIIGSLKPNPLKIYDILGNAEEIVLEPFRLNRVGRPHGQQGGIVVRGGSYQTPGEGIRVSMRTEFAPFEQTTKAEARLPTFGFRVMVSATALRQADQIATIKKEWDEASRSETSVAGKTPVQLLEDLLKQARTPTEKAQLQAALEQFNTEMGRRNELQARAIKSLLAAALTIRSNLNLSADFFDQMYGMIESGKKAAGGPMEEVGKRAEQRFKEQKPKFDSWATSYADLIQQLADFRGPDVAAQGSAVKDDLTARGRGYDGPALTAVLGDVTAYRDGRVRDTTKIIRSAIGPRKWFAP